jgi:hypothetical protein
MFNRLALIVSASLLVAAGCKEKTCPAPTPCPAEKPCGVEFDDAGKKGFAPQFVLVVDEKGRYAFSGKTPDGTVYSVPVHPKTVVNVGGKPGTTEGVFAIGCPCRLDRCIPWCRPVAPSLETPLDELFPGWAAGGGTPTEPTPAPTTPEPAPGQ